MKSELKEWIRDILIALAIAGLILVFFKPIVVKQESMQPTFYSDDYVMVSRQAYNIFGDVERGDVIIFESDLTDTSGNSKILIKRVIGLPGDTIEIKEKHKDSPRYKAILEVTGSRIVPEWLDAEDNFKGTIKNLPTREQIDVPVDEMLIVELYSK